MDKILAEADKLANGCDTGPVRIGHLQIQALAVISAQLENQLFYLHEAYTVYNQRFR